MENHNNTQRASRAQSSPTIQEFGGTVPEQLPTPDKSFNQLEREEQTRIALSQQPALFPLDGQD